MDSSKLRIRSAAEQVISILNSLVAERGDEVVPGGKWASGPRTVTAACGSILADLRGIITDLNLDLNRSDENVE